MLTSLPVGECQSTLVFLCTDVERVSNERSHSEATDGTADCRPYVASRPPQRLENREWRVLYPAHQLGIFYNVARSTKTGYVLRFRFH